MALGSSEARRQRVRHHRTWLTGFAVRDILPRRFCCRRRTGRVGQAGSLGSGRRLRCDLQGLGARQSKGDLRPVVLWTHASMGLISGIRCESKSELKYCRVHLDYFVPASHLPLETRRSDGVQSRFPRPLCSTCSPLREVCGAASAASFRPFPARETALLKRIAIRDDDEYCARNVAELDPPSTVCHSFYALAQPHT